MPFVRSHGARIYYERHGSGPAVLFCHGAGSNAATWWQQVPVFARRFSCLVYDHRCFGRSAAPEASFLPELFMDDALAILDAERIERAALVCQSLGGLTGLRLALHHPERLWAFVPCDSPLGIDHPALRDSVGRYLAAAHALPLEERALAASFVAAQPERAWLYGQINRFNPAVHTPAAAGEGLASRLAALLAPPALLATQRLGEIRCPTLFVVGEHDPLVPPAVVRDLARRVAGAEVAQIAGAGHSPYFEQPQAFNAALAGFLCRRRS